MATDFTRPTLAQLFARAQSDIEGSVAGIKALLRRRFERAVAFALAAAADSLHGHIAWVADQIFPDTAAERFLLRWCSLFGVARKLAQRSAGGITITGAGTAWYVPSGTRYVRATDGRLYETTAGASGEYGAADAPVRAVVGGIAGNMAEDDELALVTPIADVNSVAPVSTAITGGTDLESLDSLLLRLLARIRQPPMGGAPGDYVTWAREVAGVTRAWEYAGRDGLGNPGAGRVAVTFVLDDNESIIPDGAKVAEVQQYLDARAPAEVIVFAPTADPYDYSVAISPNTELVRAAIRAEVVDMIARDAIPGGKIRWSRTNEAVSAAPGEIDHMLTVPPADKDHAFGVIAVPGTLTHTDL